MRIRPLALLVFFALGIFPASAALNRDDVPEPELSYRRGDDARWAAPEWDDRDWSQSVANRLFIPVHDGIYWVRFRLRRTEVSVSRPVLNTFFWPRDEPGAPINSVFMAAPFSFEFYWDGRLLRRSGAVGATRETEVTGPLDNFIPIPEELMRPGEHTVALRVSTWHYNFLTTRTGFYLAMENYAERLVYESRKPILPLICAGVSGLTAAFCLGFFWFVDRRRLLPVGAALCAALAVFYFLIAWRWLHNDPYEWFAPRLATIAATVTLICGLQAWLLLEQFAIPRGRWWLLVLAPFLIAAWFSSPYHAVIVLWHNRVISVFSVAATGWAVWHRRIGARWALAGALIGLGSAQAMTDDRNFLSPIVLLTFGGQILGLFIAFGMQLGDDRRKAREAVLTAARLEIELLKKNIQPHFLMNTLTTIMEVIEQEPKTAVILIEALASEFRILARVSGEKLISLAQEIELCRAHIRIMSLRSGLECSFVPTGLDDNSPVPPALFHTLIEGGFTHQTPREGRLKFTLEAYYQPGLARYTLVAHGDTPLVKSPPRDGTGLRYVKARLEESFPGRWSLEAEPVAEGWRTLIEIRVLPGEEALA